MKVIDIAAYNIDGEIYYRRGKPNGKEKKKLLLKIKNGEPVQKWGGIEENKDFKKRRLFPKTSGSHCTLHETNKENIGDLIKWLQST